jgi:hypothetical protein
MKKLITLLTTSTLLLGASIALANVQALDTEKTTVYDPVWKEYPRFMDNETATPIHHQSPVEKWADEHHITTGNQPPYWVGGYNRQ